MDLKHLTNTELDMAERAYMTVLFRRRRQAHLDSVTCSPPAPETLRDIERCEERLALISEEREAREEP